MEKYKISAKDRKLLKKTKVEIIELKDKITKIKKFTG